MTYERYFAPDVKVQINYQDFLTLANILWLFDEDVLSYSEDKISEVLKKAPKDKTTLVIVGENVEFKFCFAGDIYLVAKKTENGLCFWVEISKKLLTDDKLPEPFFSVLGDTVTYEDIAT